MEALVSYVQNEFLTKKDFPEFDAGDSLTVSVSYTHLTCRRM